ncbi:NHL repeat-containing protein [candidate division KSB1 bacterium]
MKHFNFLIVVILLFSCGQEDGKTYTVEEIDGVRHVHNNAPLWGDEQKIELEFIQKIGEMETGDENYMFYMILDVAVDNEGIIYILDDDKCKISKFSRDGKFISSIGKKGEGPGEFLSPDRIKFDENGLLYVNDPGNSRISIFDQNGKFLKSILKGKIQGTYNCQIINSGEIALDGYMTIFTPPIIETEKLPESFVYPLLGIYDEKGNLLRGIGKATDYGDIPLTQLNQFKYVSDGSNNIYLSFFYQNRIDKYSAEGKFLWSADRELPIEESQGLDSGGRINFNLFSFEIQTDHRNRIWLTALKQLLNTGLFDEYTKASEYINFEVYNKDGILLTRLPYNETYYSFLRIHGERLFLIDYQYSMAVYEYRIVDK